jgi:hypothetical protein
MMEETAQKSISLPESEKTVSTMIQELYNVHNPTTGSIFTNFALRREIEKESVMSNLLDLFIASDKVCHSSDLVSPKLTFASTTSSPLRRKPLMPSSTGCHSSTTL